MADRRRRSLAQRIGLLSGDPRLNQANRLLALGSQSTPILANEQGFGRLAQTLAGTLMTQRLLQEDRQRRETARQNQLAANQAVAGLSSAVPFTNPDTGEVASPLSLVAADLRAQNTPEASRMAAQLGLQGFQSQQQQAQAKWDADLRREIAQMRIQAQQAAANRLLTPEQLKQQIQIASARASQPAQGFMIDPSNPQAQVPIPGGPADPATLAARSAAEAEVAAQAAEAQAQTEAARALPQAEATATQMLDLMDQIEGHPGLSGVVGLPSPSGLFRIPGTDETDFRVLLDQIRGQQFLQAFESLKGGGVITEIEGQKATEAIARMNEAQSEEAFLGGLREFREVVEAGLERQRAAAGQEPEPLPEGVTEADIQETMRANNLTRRQVLDRLRGR